MEELKQDIREIKTDIVEIKTTLARNTESLEHHVKRTDLNEVRIYTLEKWLLGSLAAILLAIITKFLM